MITIRISINQYGLKSWRSFFSILSLIVVLFSGSLIFYESWGEFIRGKIVDYLTVLALTLVLFTKDHIYMVNDISATSIASKIKFSNILAMDDSDRDKVGHGKRKAEELEASPSPGPSRSRARLTSPTRDTSGSPIRNTSPIKEDSPSRNNSPSPEEMSEYDDYEYSPSPPPPLRSPSVSPAPYLPLQRSKTGDFPKAISSCDAWRLA